MNIDFSGAIPTLKLDLLATVTIAVLLLMLGMWFRRRFPALEKYCIPAAVIGGLVFSILALILRSCNIMVFEFDTTLQLPFQLIFFTAIGFGGSFALIKRGGKLFLIYLVTACFVISILQNVIGAYIAKVMNIHPVLGVMAGAVSLAGGPANAAAFGTLAEKAGVQGATAVAIAAATYGIIVSGWIGGPMTKWLIERNRLEKVTDCDEELEKMQANLDKERDEDTVTTPKFMKMLALILFLMLLGSLLSSWITSTFNYSLPAYVGAMFVAIIFRNINDVRPIIKLSPKSIDLISDVSLGIFLTMALWQLYSLALPLITILIIQTIFCIAYCIWVLFPILGKNYDSAVMCTGMIGHNLGVVANTVANMDAVCSHYGVISRKAFIIVPLCGAVLTDIVGIPNILWFINHFTH